MLAFIALATLAWQDGQSTSFVQHHIPEPAFGLFIAGAVIGLYFMIAPLAHWPPYRRAPVAPTPSQMQSVEPDDPPQGPEQHFSGISSSTVAAVRRTVAEARNPKLEAIGSYRPPSKPDRRTQIQVLITTGEAAQVEAEKLCLQVAYIDPARFPLDNAKRALYRQMAQEKLSGWMSTFDSFAGPNVAASTDTATEQVDVPSWAEPIKGTWKRFIHRCRWLEAEAGKL